MLRGVVRGIKRKRKRTRKEGTRAIKGDQRKGVAKLIRGYGGLGDYCEKKAKTREKSMASWETRGAKNTISKRVLFSHQLR